MEDKATIDLACQFCAKLDIDVSMESKISHAGLHLNSEFNQNIGSLSQIFRLCFPKDSHTKSKSNFGCGICGKEFVDNRQLHRHENGVHLKLKPYECGICHEKFAQDGNRKRHEQRVHLKLKPYECGICHEKFAQDGNRRRHEQRVHLKLKPFQCGICQEKFAEDCHRRRHEQSVHLKLKPFQCGKCDKKFSQNFNRIQHEKRVHLKLKSQEAKRMEHDGLHSENSPLKNHPNAIVSETKNIEQRTDFQMKNPCPYCSTN